LLGFLPMKKLTTISTLFLALVCSNVFASNLSCNLTLTLGGYSNRSEVSVDDLDSQKALIAILDLHNDLPGYSRFDDRRTAVSEAAELLRDVSVANESVLSEMMAELFLSEPTARISDRANALKALYEARNPRDERLTEAQLRAFDEVEENAYNRLPYGWEEFLEAFGVPSAAASVYEELKEASVYPSDASELAQKIELFDAVLDSGIGSLHGDEEIGAYLVSEMAGEGHLSYHEQEEARATLAFFGIDSYKAGRIIDAFSTNSSDIRDRAQRMIRDDELNLEDYLDAFQDLLSSFELRELEEEAEKKEEEEGGGGGSLFGLF